MSSVRPDIKTPVTSGTVPKEMYDSEVAHENTLRYFVENTELSVLDKDQMGVISLVDACEHLGLSLNATQHFFTRQCRLSSAEEGKGRVQAKEVITAGAFPLSLLFGEKKTGIIESIKGFFGRGSGDTPPQRGM